MALLAAAIPAGISAIGSGINYLARRKKRTPTFASTEYGKYLRQLAEQGIYNPALRQTMIAGAGRQSGNIASQRIAKSKGYLASRGMGNSVAGARLLAQPGIERQRGIQDYEQNLMIKNEMSKQQARQQLAQGITGAEDIRRQEGKEDISQLIGGITGAVGQGVGNYMQLKQLEDLKSYREGMAEAAMARAKAGSDIPMPRYDAPDSDWLTWGKEMGYEPEETLIFRDEYLMDFLKRKAHGR
ncbi:MAG: hypothetical protein ABII90_01780 [Bacteroidota bacterium]